jgi:hypothetical protein
MSDFQKYRQDKENEYADYKDRRIGLRDGKFLNLILNIYKEVKLVKRC